MTTTIDLTRVHGCYAKELRYNTPRILNLLRNPKVSLEEMCDEICRIISPAYIDPGHDSAKSRFIDCLYNCESKQEVNALCYHAVRKAMYYKQK